MRPAAQVDSQKQAAPGRIPVPLSDRPDDQACNIRMPLPEYPVSLRPVWKGRSPREFRAVCAL